MGGDNDDLFSTFGKLGDMDEALRDAKRRKQAAQQAKSLSSLSSAH